MSHDGTRIVRDPQHGFRRLDPLPDDAELARFYQSDYFHLIRQGGRAPELRRQLQGGADAERDAGWLEQTLHADVAQLVDELAPGRRVLEIGCGTGQLLASLARRGFEGVGVEPAPEAAGIARDDHGLDVHPGDLQAFVDERFEPEGQAGFDAALLLNVLEHVVDPAGLLAQVRAVLAPGGVVVVRVPNDWNPLQLAAQKLLGGEPWWVFAPDHVHYFDFASLESVLGAVGFTVEREQGDYPMELFLLAGRNYVGDSEAGAACHAERVAIETAWPAESRRSLYEALARAGLGRNCLVAARVQESRVRADMHALQVVREGYRFVGLRRRDLEPLRGFRNAQLRVLRQTRPLSPQGQEAWYGDVVRPTHASPEPRFLLVSMLDEARRFIGYGGLTNIDWENRRAEVSFLVDPERAADAAVYERDLRAFLGFLRGWAFGPLALRRLFTETYAFRSDHLAILESEGFALEGRLRGQIRDAASPGGWADSLLHALHAETNA